MTQMLSLATDKATHQSKLGYASLRHALVCVTSSDTISVVAKAVMRYASQWFELRVGASDVRRRVTGPARWASFTMNFDIAVPSLLSRARRLKVPLQGPLLVALAYLLGAEV